MAPNKLIYMRLARTPTSGNYIFKELRKRTLMTYQVVLVVTKGENVEDKEVART